MGEGDQEKLLKTTPIYWLYKKQIKDAILAANVPVDAVAEFAKSLFEAAGGFGQLIRNHSLQQTRWLDHGRGYETESVMGFADANQRFLAKIRARLILLEKDLGVPLTRLRTLDEEAAFLGSLVSDEDDPVVQDPENEKGLSSARTGGAVSQPLGMAGNAPLFQGGLAGSPDVERCSLYSTEDIVKEILKIRLKDDGFWSGARDAFYNRHPALSGGNFWSMLPFGLPTLRIEELRIHFSELAPGTRHFGAEADRDGPSGQNHLAQQTENGQSILSRKSVEDALQFAKSGIPAELRAAMWDLILQTEITEDISVYTAYHCSKLRKMVAAYDLLIDRLIHADVRQCQSDDSYFVFEDILKDVILFWSRDPWIAGKVKPAYNICLGGATSDVYPPNGVLPLKGLSTYAMPLCLLHVEAEAVYMTFRELYVRQFESLLQQLEPMLYQHLHHTLRVTPLSIAIKWIMSAFVGVLEVEQVLLLWDRMLGFDRIDILSLVAVSLFVFRRDPLMAARTSKEVETALSDFGLVKIIPLLQYCLFLR
ncbi:hypothetical protein BJ742DRAFT_773940 [Cladochytrium replicatum]|nr:hypothetical protein BJ742DRAFT_773940 [Cladochytrium replicatum]